MKIAYVTTYDASEVQNWSGIGFFMAKALRDSGLEIHPIDKLRENYQALLRTKDRLYQKLLNRNYLRHREPLVLKSFATQVKDALRSYDCDVVFSPGTIPIAYLKTDRPIVFWTDAAFAGMVNFYPEYSKLCRESIRNGNKMEQAALNNCRFAIYGSRWAANTAINSYDVDPGKVKVVPFGANVDHNLTVNDISKIVAAKRFDRIRLLFVGVDWKRKGGDVAVEVTRRLNRAGIPATLDVVGCVPPTPQPDVINVHGFVSKDEETGRTLLDHLFRRSHFIILPSRAECFGVVFAEASSYGVPALGSNVGGVSSAVENGVNGYLFSRDADPQEYCDYILDQISNRTNYETLAISAFDHFSKNLSWRVVGFKVRELLVEAAS